MVRTWKVKQMLSRSFLMGFGRGLAAPGLLVERQTYRRDPKFNGSVEKAWEDVGKAMSDALSEEGKAYGKKTNTSRSRTRYRTGIIPAE